MLNDPAAQAKLVSTLKKVIVTSLEDDAFRANLALQIRYLFEDENTRKGVLGLLKTALNDDRIRENAMEFSKVILASEQVTAQATILGKDVVHDIVYDPIIQKKVGDGLASAVAYSVTPRWWYSGSDSKSESNKQSVPQQSPGTVPNTQNTNGEHDSMDNELTSEDKSHEESSDNLNDPKTTPAKEKQD